MPIISIFYGIIVKLYYEDHNPPHIHVEYNDHKAQIVISTGKVIGGRLPLRVSRMVNEWRKLNESAIMKAWKDAQNDRLPKKVTPLE